MYCKFVQQKVLILNVLLNNSFSKYATKKSHIPLGMWLFYLATHIKKEMNLVCPSPE